MYPNIVIQSRGPNLPAGRWACPGGVRLASHVLERNCCATPIKVKGVEAKNKLRLFCALALLFSLAGGQPWQQNLHKIRCGSIKKSPYSINCIFPKWNLTWRLEQQRIQRYPNISYIWNLETLQNICNLGHPHIQYISSCILLEFCCWKVSIVVVKLL